MYVMIMFVHTVVCTTVVSLLLFMIIIMARWLNVIVELYWRLATGPPKLLMLLMLTFLHN